MSAPAIKVESLSKRYRLGLTHAGSIREAVNRGFRRLTGRPDPGHAAAPTVHDESRVEDGSFWALKDVSFDIQPGEVVGIIGKNGAGKSTLLKILSRITKPTSGRVTLRGRVASLLEVGTGFHPELTGRENVYMNGTILGMTKREIDRRFDEIVAFAEVERFIDTPVKRYSSGMTVRLGFAVAAHLQPEILIVDEVLAVGDADFQAKCMGKMNDLGSEGRTILFVSHNMAAIQQLTIDTLVIRNGTLGYRGPSPAAIKAYLSAPPSPTGFFQDFDLERRADWAGDQTLRITRLRQASSSIPASLNSTTLRLSLSVRATQHVQRFRIGLTLHSTCSQNVGSAFTAVLGPLETDDSQDYEVELTVPGLAPGDYWFSVGALVLGGGVPTLTDVLQSVLPFEVQSSDRVASEFTAWNPSWGSVQLSASVVEGE